MLSARNRTNLKYRNNTCTCLIATSGASDLFWKRGDEPDQNRSSETYILAKTTRTTKSDRRHPYKQIIATGLS